jgi:glutamyl-tRNA synthetase
MKIVTRFAPSPTGYLHIGSARTCYFNYLFAKKNNGKFFLRIEDTDKQRSTKEAVDAIFDGLKFLSLNHDDEAVLQSDRVDSHRDAAFKLLEIGAAYKCYSTHEEIQKDKEEKEKLGLFPSYNSPWRNASQEALMTKDGAPFSIRLKIPSDKKSLTIDDLVQGSVTVNFSEMDDLILLKSNGDPTYNLCVVVDDNDMGVTHVIRGDDHLNNTFKQYLIYEALGYNIPKFAHIPLIHGQDGAKLSKRHGALGVMAYKEMGYLKEALLNYLLRLGWSHGDDEIISTDQAAEWFNLDSLNKGPSRFDFVKLNFLNAHYLKLTENHQIIDLLKDYYKDSYDLTKEEEHNFIRLMQSIKLRCQTLKEIMEARHIVKHQKPNISNENLMIVNSIDQNAILDCKAFILDIKTSDKKEIQELFTNYVKKYNLKLGNFMQALRVLITGEKDGLSVFELIAILGPKFIVNKIY